MNDRLTASNCKDQSASLAPASSTTLINAYRVVTGFLLVALLWKFKIYRLIVELYQDTPLQDDFFPRFFQSNSVLCGLYLAVIATGVGVFLTSSVVYWRFQAVTACLATWGLMLHQGSYNDVTFMTAFWTALWCLWYALRVNRDAPEVLISKGAVLANLIVAVILWAGSVGKWTQGYWSGEVFYQIYFSDRDFWCFNILRHGLSESAVRDVACYYSRFVILAEAGAALLVIGLPSRRGSLVATLVLVSIALFSNVLLFSVLLSLVGLMMVGVLFETPECSRSRSKNEVASVELARQRLVVSS